jgi:hypothetical protein
VQVPETQTGVGFAKTAFAAGTETRLKIRKRFTTGIRNFFTCLV